MDVFNQITIVIRKRILDEKMWISKIIAKHKTCHILKFKLVIYLHFDTLNPQKVDNYNLWSYKAEHAHHGKWSVFYKTKTAHFPKWSVSIRQKPPITPKWSVPRARKCLSSQSCLTLLRLGRGGAVPPCGFSKLL